MTPCAFHSYWLRLSKGSAWTVTSVGKQKGGLFVWVGWKEGLQPGWFCSVALKPDASTCQSWNSGAACIAVLLRGELGCTSSFSLSLLQEEAEHFAKEQQAMQVSATEASSSQNGGMGSQDATLGTCTETLTFTEVLEEDEWESFYYSFKVGFLVCLFCCGGGGGFWLMCPLHSPEAGRQANLTS